MIWIAMAIESTNSTCIFGYLENPHPFLCCPRADISYLSYIVNHINSWLAQTITNILKKSSQVHIQVLV